MRTELEKEWRELVIKLENVERALYKDDRLKGIPHCEARYVTDGD